MKCRYRSSIMSMKRTLALLFVFMLALSAFTGCNDKTDKVVKIEVGSAAGQLLSAIKYTDEMTAIEKEAALYTYGIEAADVSECSVYVGTAATVEEIAVFRADNEEAAARILSKVNDRINVQRVVYTDYRPAEVPKLDAAVVEQQGTLVILCISPDSQTAKNTVKNIIENGTEQEV